MYHFDGPVSPKVPPTSEQQPDHDESKNPASSSRSNESATMVALILQRKTTVDDKAPAESFSNA